MIALSIRQPWAWLIVNGFKDIENRDWPTRYRGRFLVHAGKKPCSLEEYVDALDLANLASPIAVEGISNMKDLEYGGVVGEATLTDCVTEHTSPWFTPWPEEFKPAGVTCYGFVLANARPLPFMPYKGRLKFFDVRGDKP